jgi:Mn2+/Fe2+ NRAMP family transporter
VQEGVFNGTPSSIAQTTDGYLWIGTNSGLIRFDGVRFVDWENPATKSRWTVLIRSLLGAKDGSLWIGTGAAAARHGITHIETTRQAAEALRPLAGKFAATLFTVGIVGVGFLAIPTLAGSAAYAFAETLGWRQGLDKKLKQARAFYALILLSTGVGVGLDFAGINPVKALYWTAVINGLLAPFLLIAILVVASDKKLMQSQPSSRLGWIVVAITTVAMFAAGVAMFVV